MTRTPLQVQRSKVNVLGVAGVRRVGYGPEVGRSVRTAGGAGHIVSPRAQLVYYWQGSRGVGECSLSSDDGPKSEKRWKEGA